jgi:hypothetical protein
MKKFDEKWSDLFCNIITKDGHIEIITPKGEHINGIVNVTVTEDPNHQYANAVVTLFVKLGGDKLD